jgi:SM-20-related protein
MPSHLFFRSAGLFVNSEFLYPAECADIRAQMREATSRKALIAKSNADVDALDESQRKVLCVSVEKPLATLVKTRLLEVKPRLEEHFRVPLTGCQGPDFLRYNENAFYKLHRDVDPEAPPGIIHRKVSAVIFLNATSRDQAADGYTGGALTFYSLLPGPQWEKCAFSLEAPAGLLIAFPSNMPHEVQPVTSGQRFTIACWFTNNG